MKNIDLINEILRKAFEDSEVFIEDFSEKHAKHQHNNLKHQDESHLKIVIFSNILYDLPKLDRHRRVKTLLKGMLKDRIHALSLEFKRKESS
ncbi:MAG: BolA family transcriptional regulator [Alphaproteobacteria bacterium]|nr:BolA family transcriptional regulator [Alphaproteobacteria bacterium]OJV13900.1 MAG: hypothetical protein BGO27_08405 [Alphaproteobacteria bacterium 33-17]